MFIGREKPAETIFKGGIHGRKYGRYIIDWPRNKPVIDRLQQYKDACKHVFISRMDVCTHNWL